LQEHWPGATFQIVNLGGALPMLLERMDHIVATRDPAAPLPSTLLGDLLFDTASLGPRSIEIAVAVLGAGRLMFGTDFPIFDSLISSEALMSARISEGDRAAIASGTAQRLYGPPAPP
jgi:predicted TIM-barrel fold metal-dependent hydrolase